MATDGDTFEKGQMVRVEFVDEYGHTRTETVEVEVVSIDGTMFSATYMAHGREVYVREPTDAATLMVARVGYGWGAYCDFATIEEALQEAAKLAAEPVSDPSLRSVSIIDLTRRTKFGSFPTLIEVKCPAPVEAGVQHD